MCDFASFLCFKSSLDVRFGVALLHHFVVRLVYKCDLAIDFGTIFVLIIIHVCFYILITVYMCDFALRLHLYIIYVLRLPYMSDLAMHFCTAALLNHFLS